LVYKWVRMCDNTIEYKGGVFDMKQVAQKWLNGDALFKVVLKSVLFWNCWHTLREKGYILSIQDFKRVPFHLLSQLEKGIIKKTFSHMGTQFDTKLSRGYRTALY
jgi:hypothetical protein